MLNVESLYDMLRSNRYFPYFTVKTQYERRDLPREELEVLWRAERKAREGYTENYENPFMSIPVYADRFFAMFSKGDDIVVQEKIDGSNTHLTVLDTGFKCYSNNCVLNKVNHLQGYYFWCKDHFGQVPDKYFGIDIYGEWLVPHHCEYPADRYGEFYVFDVMEDGKYWEQDKVEALARECGFEYAPVLFRGSFESWRHIVSLVGKTKLGGDRGEGVVIKNQTTLNSTRVQFYIKIVSKEFQETNPSRKYVTFVDMDKLIAMEQGYFLSESIVTAPRVRKVILKLVDDGVLPAQWSSLSDLDILRAVKSHVYRDCLKEEKDVVDKIGKLFGRHCNDLVSRHIITLKKEVQV